MADSIRSATIFLEHANLNLTYWTKNAKEIKSPYESMFKCLKNKHQNRNLKSVWHNWSPLKVLKKYAIVYVFQYPSFEVGSL